MSVKKIETGYPQSYGATVDFHRSQEDEITISFNIPDDFPPDLRNLLVSRRLKLKSSGQIFIEGKQISNIFFSFLTQ